MVCPIVICGCESWTIKTVECQRIDAFELWCWRRLLRVPWTARRSNQSILKEISPEYLLEGLMLKLKLQYFGHLMQKADLKLNIQKAKIMAFSPITLGANRWGNNGTSDRLYFLGLQQPLKIVTAAMKLKDACPLKEKL